MCLYFKVLHYKKIQQGVLSSALRKLNSLNPKSLRVDTVTVSVLKIITLHRFSTRFVDFPRF